MSGKLNASKGKSRTLVLLFIDFLCAIGAYTLFFNVRRLPLFLGNEITLAVILMVVSVFLSRYFLLVYRQMWRYASSEVFLRMTVADALGGIAYFLIDRFLFHRHVPMTVAVAAVSTGLLLTLSSRFVYQTMRRRTTFFGNMPSKPAIGEANKINVAIVGAGEMGVLLARELLANRSARYHPYCFFDNDPRKIGIMIEGIPVYGPDDEVVSQVNAMPIHDIIIAMPNLSPQSQQAVFDTYKRTNCRVMIYDYPIDKQDVAGQKRMIREVNIKDLLFRDMVSLDDEQVHENYRGKVVLVTGAGGSIGSELCRQIARMAPQMLVMLDVYENGVYDIQQELIRRYGGKLQAQTIIATICDARRMEEVFDQYRPDIVFHAAAHKHVPLMEENCAEAVTNNVFGTYNVVNAAEKSGVQRFVMVSTDKAVNPTNVMGATKRMCEIIIQSRKDSRTDFVAVRFGNVLGSNGSVVPLFKQQIAEGGPVTITDKRIIRYFMAIPEAAQLVLRTGCFGEKGELYVLDMGKPVRILDLAENLISLSGFIPYQDIKIEEVGLRPGEKLYEELLIKTEDCQKTSDERIFIERDEARNRREVETMLARLQTITSHGGDNAAVRDCLMQLIPTYKPPELVNQAAADAREVKEAVQHRYSDVAVTPSVPG